MTLDKAFVLSEPISPSVKWKPQQYMPHRRAVRVSRRLWSVFLGCCLQAPTGSCVEEGWPHSCGPGRQGAVTRTT